MKKIQAATAIAASLCVAAGLLAGCEDHTRLSDLLADPSRYVYHDVRVVGRVTKVYELPLGITNLAAYRINDNTGQIWVVSHIGAPFVGDRVGIQGRVEPVADVKLPVVGDILGNVIEEHKRRGL